MAKYNVLIKQSATKELEHLPKPDLKKVVQRIQSLTNNPRPHGCQKLSHKEQYRIRQGDYRIVYAVRDEAAEVHIVKIGHRREVYRQ